MTVVEARSYSRNSGAISCEATTCADGWRRLSSAATVRSCSGWRNEKRRQTAIASASSSGSESRSSGASSPSLPDPPFHADAVLERDERRRMRLAGPVEVRPRLPPEVQQVLEPCRGHERRPRAAALEERVRRDRRPVGEAADPLEADRRRCGEHGRLLAPRGRHLRRPYAAVLDEDGVRERPTDVDPQEPAGGGHGRILACRTISRRRSPGGLLRFQLCGVSGHHPGP